MELSLAQVQDAMSARFSFAGESSGLQPVCELRLRGWSIDSRTLNAGDLFFAIRGENFDGHAYLRAAFDRGAAAAVVSQAPDTAIQSPLLQVADTLAALQKVAHTARKLWNKPVVAVTGSAGKTSTKDIIAQLLSARFEVGKTAGNFNNHIGLPLSLLRIPDTAEIAVIEIGMNHAGEIRDLAAIAEPQVGVVTNVGYAHVEAFSSIDGVAAAKRELIEALPPEGIAILNADDVRVLSFRTAHPGHSVTYGFSPQAAVRATDVEFSVEKSAFTVDGVRFETDLIGEHSVLNILAGLAVSGIFKIGLNELVPCVKNLAPGKMRGERKQWRGITILDDCYNSNPEAAHSMVDVLSREPALRRIAVLGEMLELGHMAESLHRELGKYLARTGIDVLIGVRGVACFMVDEARKAGYEDHAALFFDDPESVGAFLRSFAKTGDAILFKGSRGTHVERAIETMQSALAMEE